MGENIVFNNGELLVEEFNDNLKTHTQRAITFEEFERYYGSVVKFSDDLTIEGFIKALRPFFEKIDSHFIAFSGGFLLEKYYEQMLLPAEDDKENDKISHVEMHWNAEVNEWDDDVHSIHHSDFHLNGDYSGIPKEKDDPYYSFSLSNINNWKHYNFKLNTEVKCYHFSSERLLDENGEIPKCFVSNMEWTLFELLRHFINELTFHGYPESTSSMREELSERSEEIKKAIDEGEELQGTSLSEFMLELYEKDLEEAGKIENYEGMKKIQEKIDKLKEEIKKEKEEEDDVA